MAIMFGYIRLTKEKSQPLTPVYLIKDFIICVKQADVATSSWVHFIIFGARL